MTLKVRISHASPGYLKRASVQVFTPETMTPQGEPHLLADGQSVELYVHSGAAIRVDEIDQALGVTDRHAPIQSDDEIRAEADRLRAEGRNVQSLGGSIRSVSAEDIARATGGEAS